MEDKRIATLEEEKMEIFTFSLNPNVMKDFERIVGSRKRSEKIRDLVRDFVDKNKVDED